MERGFSDLWSVDLVSYGTRIFADLADFRGFFPCKFTAVEWKFCPCKLRIVERGFNGFSRIWRIGSWENISPFSRLRGQNPRNPCKSAFNAFKIRTNKNPRNSHSLGLNEHEKKSAKIR
ncbi:MAG: hypothetical protein FWG87_00600 [Defluviitaleaceae bacterium]|nr:hypothetical protein [Defluviitaleaceae bacterium]